MKCWEEGFKRKRGKGPSRKVKGMIKSDFLRWKTEDEKEKRRGEKIDMWMEKVGMRVRAFSGGGWEKKGCKRFLGRFFREKGRRSEGLRWQGAKREWMMEAWKKRTGMAGHDRINEQMAKLMGEGVREIFFFNFFF